MTNIQLDTSLRRSTFTVESNSPIKRVVKKVNVGSLSPLSFDKCNFVQKENKDPLKLGGVKKVSLNDFNHSKNENPFDIKQEKNGSIKTSSTKRNLFSEKTVSEEVHPKYSSYLKRQSVSRALPGKVFSLFVK